MRVLYVGGFNLPDKNAAAQRVVANAKILRDLGHQVSLAGLGAPTDVFTFEGFDCRNLKYPESLPEWNRYLFSIRSLKPLIKEYEPSLIIAYNYPARALDKLRGYCSRHRIKIVADCTEWYTPVGSLLFRWIKAWDTEKRMKEVHPKLDGVISISRFLQDYYTGRGVKTVLLPPLVDLEDDKWKLPVSERMENGTIRLVYAGSPGHKDRLDTIVRLLSEAEDALPVSFTIIGITEAQFRDNYQYLSPISPDIEFKGRISHEEVLSDLMQADFQVFIREDNITTKAGFPTKFVESISSGVPVLSNLTSNLDDYLSDGKNGFVLNASTDAALASSLDRVLHKSFEEIEAVKHSIDRSIFDYRRFIPVVKDFLGTI